MTVVSKKKPAAAASTSQRAHRASTAAAMVKTEHEVPSHIKHDMASSEDNDEDYMIALVQDPGATAITVDGTTFDLPKGSVVRADRKNRSLICPFSFESHAVGIGEELTLAHEATLTAPKDSRIRLPGGVFGQVLDLPAGTLMLSESKLWRYKKLPFGGGHLQQTTELPDDVEITPVQPFKLTHPLLLQHDVRLRKDTVLTRRVVLAGQLQILSDTKFSGKVVPFKRNTVDVNSGVNIKKTYEPEDVLFKNTILLSGTVLPASITLVKDTEIPKGTTLPVGTVLETPCLAAGTNLPAGFFLPQGAWVPPQVFRHIKLVRDQHNHPDDVKLENHQAEDTDYTEY